MKILISGTGIAGAAAALYLKGDGHELIVIDRAPSFQKLGYGLSLKSFGLSVMEDLGLLSAIQQREIAMKTVQVFDSHGALLHEYRGDDAAAASNGAVIVYRSELHAVLYAPVEKILRVRFGTVIESLETHGEGVRATLSDGSAEMFDLVIVGEGLHSSTRRLLWGEQGYKPFGIVYAAASMTSEAGVAPGVIEWYMGTGKNLAVIPVDEKTLLIQLYFRGTVAPDAHKESTRNLVRATFRDFAPRGAAVVERATASDSMFCDNVAMVTLPQLFRERVVFLGDAGYCPTFLSGMGASLGLVGAKALQKSLRNTSAGIACCLQRYDDLMRPLIQHFQASAERNADDILSQSRLRSRLRDWVLRGLPSGLATKAWGRQFRAEADLVREILKS